MSKGVRWKASDVRRQGSGATIATREGPRMREQDPNDPVKLWCRASGLPEPETEGEYHQTRHWRADWIWRAEKVILEQEGGFFRSGAGGGTAISGHSSVTGILRDMEKSNAAQLLGYLYLRFTPEQIKDGSALLTVAEALRARRAQVDPQCALQLRMIAGIRARVQSGESVATIAADYAVSRSMVRRIGAGGGG